MLYSQVNATPLPTLSKTGPQFHFLRIFEKKHKETKITSQSSSLNSNFVDIVIPLVVCSISVSVP